jgi:hypothetical protein
MIPEKPKEIQPFLSGPPPLGVLLGFLSLLYILCIHYYYVGYFGDDALFIVMAKSLWQGHYAAIYTPHPAALSYPMPGYPLFLMPFVKLFGPHWNALQLISLILTVISVALLWRLLTEWVSPMQRFFIVLLYAVNPLILRMSGTVMAEPLYVVCLLRLFAGLQSLPQVTRSNLWKEGLWLGAASLLRPHAVVLLPIVAFLYRKSLGWKERAWLFTPSLLGLGTFVWRNQQVATSSAQGNFLPTLLSGISFFLRHPFQLYSHLLRLLYENMVHALLGVTLPYHGWGVPAGYAAIGFSLGLVAFGFVRCLQKNSRIQTTVAATGSFCLLNFMVLFLWPAIDTRYAVPMLPFLVVFLAKGVIEAWHDFPAWKIPLFTLCGCLLLHEGYEVFETTQDALSNTRPSYRRMPTESLEWVKTHTSKETLFLGDGALLYLYTERRAWDIMPADTVLQFHQELRDHGVDYIFLQFLPMLNVPKLAGSARLDRAGPWLYKEPVLFPVSYENNYEGVCIFKVSP